MDTKPATLAMLISKEKEKILACVHCGLCLESCPTYRATGNENDGPRGRIYLMRAVEEGKLAADSRTFERHIDRCLGCRACEQVCPSGVEYGNLLEVSRAEIRAARKSHGLAYTLQSLLLRHIWPYPGRLGLFFWLSRVLRDLRLSRVALKSGVPALFPRRLSLAIALLEASRAAAIRFSKAEKAAAGSAHKLADLPKRRALLFTGCVTSGLFGRVNEATSRVLRVNGYAAETPKAQACCGALHLHSGDIEGARKLARRNIAVFDAGEAAIVSNAGGCGAMLISYGHLLADDAEFCERARSFSSRVKDIGQAVDLDVLKDGSCHLEGGPVTYDASCHLLHGQKASGDSERMIASALGPDLVPLAGSDVCCGGAGVYNLLEPELSSQILKEKLESVMATKATFLATGNPGCHMQIAAGAMLAGTGLKVCHPVEILDAFYECAGLYHSD